MCPGSSGRPSRVRPPPTARAPPRRRIAPERLNRAGGGLARGHPIGASGAIALVRLLADMAREAPPGALGLTAIAAAGGLGSAALIEKL